MGCQRLDADLALFEFADIAHAAENNDPGPIVGLGELAEAPLQAVLLVVVLEAVAAGRQVPP